MTHEFHLSRNLSCDCLIGVDLVKVWGALVFPVTIVYFSGSNFTEVMNFRVGIFVFWCDCKSE